MLHSYGDSELVCGLDAAGTAGAWRSPRGMLAITKRPGCQMGLSIAMGVGPKSWMVFLFGKIPSI